MVLKNLQKEFPEYQKIEIQLQQNFSLDDKIIIDSTRNINLGKGIAYIPVTVIKGNKFSASIISVKIKLLKKLLVAGKDFQRKEFFTTAGFEEKNLDVTRINGNPVKINFAAEDYQAKIFIKKGEIIFEENIEKIPLINIGDKVSAEVINGNVIVSTEAFARQRGGAGDLIELVSAGNKIFKARIIDATKVIVE
jgi:flagella basal body P-ring formation protein FlgA